VLVLAKSITVPDAFELSFDLVKMIPNEHLLFFSRGVFLMYDK